MEEEKLELLLRFAQEAQDAIEKLMWCPLCYPRDPGVRMIPIQHFPGCPIKQLRKLNLVSTNVITRDKE